MNVTGETTPASDTALTTSADSITGRVTRPGTFASGHDTRRNTAGRPKKGESFADKYRKRLEKDADSLIEAHVRRAQGSGTVAARDFELAAAYAMGRPVQKYEYRDTDSPLLGFLMRHTAQLPYVDGESRDITTADSAQS